MFIQKLRRRLFGFKKADVFAFITEIDEKAAEKLAEKDKQIEELKARVAELEANREAIVNALKFAEEKAKEIVDEAQEKADTMRKDAENEIQAKKEALEQEIQIQKSNVNREIEIKRKAIKSYYSAENKKIDQIKDEVERMRRASLDAIQNFERQLREVERMTENSSSYLGSAMNYSQTGSALDTFNNVEQDIPVHIVESISE